MNDKDITSQVQFGGVDGELLPLTKCACGQEFDYWDFVLSIYRVEPDVCPNCGRKMYFKLEVTVYEVVE